AELFQQAGFRLIILGHIDRQLFASFYFLALVVAMFAITASRRRASFERGTSANLVLRSFAATRLGFTLSALLTVCSAFSWFPSTASARATLTRPSWLSATRGPAAATASFNFV